MSGIQMAMLMSRQVSTIVDAGSGAFGGGTLVGFDAMNEIGFLSNYAPFPGFPISTLGYVTSGGDSGILLTFSLDTFSDTGFATLQIGSLVLPLASASKSHVGGVSSYSWVLVTNPFTDGVSTPAIFQL